MSILPTLFVSHGAPTFALQPGIIGPKLTALGRALPRPEAVLVVSPHWMTQHPRVTTSSHPVTLHDFGGFDPALYAVQYPAAGHPGLALRTRDLLREHGWQAGTDDRRGLDHGAWVPMLHLYPRADVPVIQVSLPAQLDADACYRLGRALAHLSIEGVLVVGSGSLTHNLHEFFSGFRGDVGYVAEFAAWVREAVTCGDHERLLRALSSAPHAARAHPTPEHYWPLLVAAGAAPEASSASVLDGGVDQGVLAMDSFVFASHPTGDQSKP